jgi:hypothetical protein
MNRKHMGQALHQAHGDVPTRRSVAAREDLAMDW